MTSRSFLFFSIAIAISVSVSAQVVTYWDGPFVERWSSPGNTTSHDGPVSICIPESSDSRCPNEAGWGSGMFHLNGVIYNLFLGNSRTAANAQGDIDNYLTNPDYIGDHVDAFFRYDSDGTYGRVFNFFTLPRNGDLHTLADSSVRQEDSPDELPSVYQTTISQRTDWQGGGVAGFLGPKLDTDPPGSQRFFAFGGIGSHPLDGGDGAHLIAFASVSVPAGVQSFYVPFSSWWKDSSSANDPEYKLAHNIPLRTLHVKEFTPVLIFRGEGDLPVHAPGGGPAAIKNPQYLHGASGWYHNGYFYLLLALNMTEYRDGVCGVPRETTGRIGLILVRVKTDLTGAHGYGGLWLDSAGRPQIDLYRVNGTLPRAFVPLPHPDQVVSFTEGTYAALCAGGYNRQFFAGAGANPPEYAADFSLHYPASVGSFDQAFLLPSSVFTFDGCTQYIVMNKEVDVPPEGNTRAYVMSVTDANCSGSTPQPTFAHAGVIDYPLPGSSGQYTVDVFTSGAWPNVSPMIDNTTLLGYRTVLDTTTNVEAQYSFTMVPNFFDCHFTVPSPLHISSVARTGSFTLTASGTQCAWKTDVGSSFISVPDTISGTGSAVISYSITANSSTSGRIGHIRFGDQDFLIAQEGGLLSPMDLVATIQNGPAIQLSWQASSGATSYELQRSTDSGPFVTISTAASTSFSDTTAVVGTAYLYQVRAVNGSGSSLFSDMAQITIAAPAVTTGSASAIGQTVATLNATVNPNGSSTSTAFDYGLSPSFGSTISVQTLSGSTVQSIAATVPGLSCNTPYYFRARATNAGGATLGATQTFTTSACTATQGFYTLTPCRMIDTRGSSSLASAATRNITVTGICGIPSSGVTALSVNVTAVNGTSAGTLTLFPGPAGASVPIANTVSYATRVIAGAAMVRVNGDGTINMYNTGPNAVHFIIDINGYFR